MNKNSKYKFVLSREIMERNAFTGAIVYAKQRSGKSSYAMQVLYDIYGNWDDVFKNMFFKLEDITDYLTLAIQEKKKIPAIIWDDAGLHANKMVYFSRKDYAEYIQNLFDVIGTACSGLILTTPNPGNLLKCLRDYEFMRIKIYPDFRGHNSDNRMAKGYSQNLLPSGTTRVRSKFEDFYNVMLPKDVYERYQPIREGYYIEALTALHDHIKSHNVVISDEDMEELEIKNNERYC